MARKARLSSKGRFVHCYNRVCGEEGYLPFGPREKAKFFTIIEKIEPLYEIEILSAVCMSNHIHLVLKSAELPPSLEETARRYNTHHKESMWIFPTTDRCREIQQRLNDISWFMRDLQQEFTTWFNNTRETKRRGKLWQGRFKNTILQSGGAVVGCVKYVEMNPVRAKICTNPADYQYCTWGRYAQTGTHPFADSFYKNMQSCLKKDPATVETTDETNRIDEYFLSEFARIYAYENEESDILCDLKNLPPENTGIPFDLIVSRRVRYWSDL